MKKKIFIPVLLVILIIVILFLCRCDSREEYVSIPVPDESNIVIDEVTLEQIEERARELETKYTSAICLEYEDFYSLLVATNYDYLSEEARQQWNKEYDNYTERVTACLDYCTWSYFFWDFQYHVNRGRKDSGFYKCPRFPELFFDDDLIAQAEFLERQLYNYIYVQDEAAIYNITTYLFSETHPNATEFAPLHYKGEIMQGCAGFCMHTIITRVFRETISRDTDEIEGYSNEFLGRLHEPTVYSL